MRISDWSSDVCSSDLVDEAGVLRHLRFFDSQMFDDGLLDPIGCVAHASYPSKSIAKNPDRPSGNGPVPSRPVSWAGLSIMLPVPMRSEEHTSELQSLMRISYAVFCLEKKTRP